jgi:hypothetical protein
MAKRAAVAERSNPTNGTAAEPAPDDGVRWLVSVLVELARRFIGHAVKRYPDLGSQKHACPKCGYRN